MPGSGRQYYRYRIDGQIKVVAFRPNEKLQLWGRVSDVSKGGMGAVVSGELEPGEFVAVQFSLVSSPDILELRARVCHRRGYYCGFEFLVVTDMQRERIMLACAGLPAKDNEKQPEHS
jgi:c-di-GMP-binding flagellar brake protein YcgR